MNRIARWLFRGAQGIALAVLAAATPVGAQTLVIGEPDYVVGTPYGEVGERMMAELATRSGIAIKLRPLPPLRAIEMANSGELDGEIARILEVAARYPNLEPLAVPFSTYRLVLFSMSPDIMRKSRADIRQLRIGIQRGVFVAAKSTAGLNVIEAGGPDALLELLRTGRVDVIAAELLSASAYLRAYPLPGIQRWPHAWAAEPVHMLIHKKHTLLLPRLNAAARQMQRDGTIDRFDDDALREVQAAPLLPEPPAR